MLQVKNRPSGPFKIKSIRTVSDTERGPDGGACSINSGDGTDKPPC